MKFKTMVKMMLLLAVSSLMFACGGGSTGAITATPTPVDNSTTVAGKVMAGEFSEGTVDLYGVTNNIIDATPFKQGVALDSTGSFSVNIGTRSGQFVAKAYGKYKDEATGNTVTLTVANPLQVAVPSTVAGTLKLSITPVTTVAVVKAGTDLSAANITAQNSGVAKLFGISDITTVTPVAATALAAASDDAKKYTTLLAVLSQLTGTDPTTITTKLTALATNIDTKSATPTAGNSGTDLVAATTALLANTTNATVKAITADTSSNSFISSVKSGSLINGGKPIFPVKLKSVGTGSIGSFNAISVTLPTTVSVSAVTASGTDASAATVAFKTTAQTTVVSVTTGSQTGFAVGEFLTIYCTYPAGTTSAPLTDATISGAKVYDLKGNDVTSAFSIVAF